jgi:site-specific recombinase XerD
MTQSTLSEDLISAFGHWLTSEGRSPRTVRTYSSELGSLSAWAAPASLAELAPADLGRYVQAGDERGASPATHNVRVAALRAFFGWLASTSGGEQRNIACDLRTLEAEASQTPHLSRKAIRSLLVVLEGNLRDTAIMLLLLSTGVRVSELVAADREDVEETEEGMEIAIDASGHELTVYPSEQASDALLAYLASRDDLNEALFVARTGQRLAPRTVQASFARHFKAAGVEGSLRTFRHTFGVYRAAAGMEMGHVQRLLGLRTARSVERYRPQGQEDLRTAARDTEEQY